MSTSQDISPRQRGMTPVRVTLSAGVPQRFSLEGDYVHCLTSPAGVTDLTARFDESEKVPVPQGVGFRRYYRELELESATGGAFVVYAGFGSVFDARASFGGTVNTTLQPGAIFTNGGDVTLTTAVTGLVLAADPARLYATITNPSTNTVTVRLGNATVDATSGTPIEPGQTLSIYTTAAIYGYQASGGSVTISANAVQV